MRISLNKQTSQKKTENKHPKSTIVIKVLFADDSNHVCKQRARSSVFICTQICYLKSIRYAYDCYPISNPVIFRECLINSNFRIKGLQSTNRLVNIYSHLVSRLCNICIFIENTAQIKETDTFPWTKIGIPCSYCLSFV